MVRYFAEIHSRLYAGKKGREASFSFNRGGSTENRSLSFEGMEPKGHPAKPRKSDPERGFHMVPVRHRTNPDSCKKNLFNHDNWREERKLRDSVKGLTAGR